MHLPLQDNEGGTGAGIYNLGKVNIKGDSVFNNLNADFEQARMCLGATKRGFEGDMH